MPAPYNPYSSPNNKPAQVPVKLVPGLYVRSAPTAPLSRADLQATTRPPIAIVATTVREAQVFIQEARAHIKQAERDASLVLADYEEFGRRWKEFGPTKNLAYQAVYDASPNAIRQRIHRIQENLDKSSLIDEDGQPLPTSKGATSSQDKQNSLAKIAALPDPPKVEEPEKPHIRTKDEIEAEQAKPEPRKAVTENGKPKYLLAVWRELQDAYGRALNRLDEANRACPYKTEHDELISITKQCMRRADQWHERCKHV